MQVELLKERARKWKFTYLEKKSSEEKEKLKLTGSLLLFILFLHRDLNFLLLVHATYACTMLFIWCKKSKEQVKKD